MFKTPTENNLAHIFLNMMIKRSKKWKINDSEDLIVRTRTEYELLQKYRELKNSQTQQQTQNMIDTIKRVDYNEFEQSESARKLFYEREPSIIITD